MKLYLMTDMEGVAGVLDHDNWVLPTGPWYKTGVELLTAEVNAAIEGFLQEGFHEIVVNDGHGAGGIDPTLLNPAAQLLRHAPTPVWPWCLDASYDAVAWVGQHAKAGTPNSHLTHTGWFDTIDESINDLSIGEYGELALCAWELGIPCIFAAGEQALCDEATALTPGIVTVPVKWGLQPDGPQLHTLDEAQYRRAKLAARHLSPQESRNRIREGALLAAYTLMTQKTRFTGPALQAPYVCRRVYRGIAGGPIRRTVSRPMASVVEALNAPRQADDGG